MLIYHYVFHYAAGFDVAGTAFTPHGVHRTIPLTDGELNYVEAMRPGDHWISVEGVVEIRCYRS